MSSKKSRPPQVNIRMTDDLRVMVKQIAVARDRSVNYMIVQAVKEFVLKNSETPQCENTNGASNCQLL